MEKGTKEYISALARGMAEKLVILGIVVGLFVLGHIYRGAATELWLTFLSILQ